MLEAFQLAAFAIAGLLLGGASFAALRLNTALYLSGGVWRSLALHLARIALVALGLVVVARQGGAGPLLAGAAGLVMARWVAVRLWGRVA
jgi:hypothetical protein